MESRSLDIVYTSFAVLVISTFLIFYVTNKFRAASKSKTPPKPPGSWTIIGHLRLLAGPNLPHEALGAVADNLGSIFMIKLGVRQALVVSSPEIAKQLFTTNDLAVSSRPQNVAIKILAYDSAMFGFAPYGEYWRKVRKIVTVELLSNRRLELLKHVCVSEVETSTRELYKIWELRNMTNESSQGVVVEMKKWFGDLTMNVILRMIAGKKCYGTSSDNDPAEALKCQDAIRSLSHYLGMFVLRDAVPSLGWLDLGGHEKGMKKTAKVLDGIIGQWLEEHKQDRRHGRVNREQDFMDVLLSILDGNELGSYDSDTVIKSTCLSMIAGAADSTLVTMTWAISLLLNNKNALKKVQEELDACVGRERTVKDSDISNLTYLQAVVKETLRLYPPGPLSAPRLFTEDCTVGGYLVPKGTWLMVNLWKIQTDSRFWPNPFEFKPERFLTTNKDLDVRGQCYELIPFGSGRRICPGISFGLQNVHLTLATLLHAFEVSTPDDAPVDMAGTPGLTNLKATPLHVLISPRLSKDLYTD